MGILFFFFYIGCSLTVYIEKKCQRTFKKLYISFGLIFIIPVMKQRHGCFPTTILQLNKYLLSSFLGPGTLLGSGDTAACKIDTDACPQMAKIFSIGQVIGNK
jgi:hypothetical protein